MELTLAFAAGLKWTLTKALPNTSASTDPVISSIALS